MKNLSSLAVLCALAFPVLARADDAPAAPDEPIRLAAAKPANAPAGVAAEVNGEKIPLADVERAVAMIKESDEGLQANTPEVKDALEKIRQAHLENMITQALFSQDARKRKIAPAKAEVDKSLAELQKGMTPDEIKKSLAADGKTIDDIRGMISDDLAIRELSRRLTGDITVSDAEVSASYRADAATWTAPETARASHILIAFIKIPGIDPNAIPTAPQKQKLLVRANEVAKQAKLKNADFAALAKKFSEDPESAKIGGDIGDFDRDSMIKEISGAVFANPVGAVIGPVESQFGYHIIRVTGKKPTALIPLDFDAGGTTVREVIKARLLRQKVQVRLDAHLKSLRAAANIKKYI